jgi:hypothetical protein
MTRARRLILAALLFACLPGCRAVAEICLAGLEAAASSGSRCDDRCDGHRPRGPR